MRSSGYGLMVVKTTNFAADAEQTALFGASRCPPTTENCPVYHSKRAKPQQARKTAPAVPPDVLVKPPKCLVTQKNNQRQAAATAKAISDKRAARQRKRHQARGRGQRRAKPHTRRKNRREKLHQDGRGGYSHPWRHPRPLGIDPAQQNEGLARQTPKTARPRTFLEAGWVPLS